jgi:hypothetical protein
MSSVTKTKPTDSSSVGFSMNASIDPARPMDHSKGKIDASAQSREREQRQQRQTLAVVGQCEQA